MASTTAWTAGAGAQSGRLGVIIEADAVEQLSGLSALYNVPIGVLVMLTLKMVLADPELVLDLLDSATAWRP